ncbi:myb-like protein X [Thalassophryne amazonica]|uniref:myb-like protein X n=1 Tax=Thalassophryne amazonica TaxID=390379 RepID=UPI0014710333|nr:myb-like protein X [Thalassophryne amazonica]
MKSKELSLPMKQDIIRLKNENKPIREIAKTLGVAKSTIWYILKKERNGQLRNYQRTGRPRVTSVVDDRRILALLEKNPLTTVDQIKNTLQELGVFVSKSTIKRRVQQSRYRGFTRRFTPALEASEGTTEKGTSTEELHTGSNCKMEVMEGECSDPAAKFDKPDVAEEVEVSSAPTQQSPASDDTVEGDYPNQNKSEQDCTSQNEDQQDYLNQDEAQQDYLNQNEAQQDYLNQNEAEQDYLNQNEAEQDYADQNEAEQDYADQNEAEQDYADQNEAEQDYADQNEAEQDYAAQNEAEPDQVDQMEDDVDNELSLETSSEVTMPHQALHPPSEPAHLPPADDWSSELPTDDLFTGPMSQTSTWGGAKMDVLGSKKCLFLHQ